MYLGCPSPHFFFFFFPVHKNISENFGEISMIAARKFKNIFQGPPVEVFNNQKHKALNYQVKDPI